MNTLMAALAAFFVAHAQPVKVECYAYHGNWNNPPTKTCKVFDGGHGGKVIKVVKPV